MEKIEGTCVYSNLWDNKQHEYQIEQYNKNNKMLFDIEMAAYELTTWTRKEKINNLDVKGEQRKRFNVSESPDVLMEDAE